MTADAPKRSGTVAWRQLLRVPNLFTVPGDPIAGCLLAASMTGTGGVSSGRLLAAALPSLLLYCAGLIQNDCFDMEEDLRDRPDRPLPSGAVPLRTAFTASATLAAAGVIVAAVLSPAALPVAALLATAMTLYNRGAKRLRLLGPILMGTCRGLSLLLGAAALGGAALSPLAVWGSALFLTAYIAAVTHLAAGETHRSRIGPARWLPGAVLIVWLLPSHTLLQPRDAPSSVACLALAVTAVLWTLYCGGLLKDAPPPKLVQQTIGRFLQGLILIQATLAAASGQLGLCVAAVLLVFWPVSRRLAKRFYAS